MAEKPRYAIYDTAQRQYLASFKKPVKGVDAAVTLWTRKPDHAQRFPGVKSARGVAEWLNGKKYEVAPSVARMRPQAQRIEVKQDAGETRDRAQRQAWGVGCVVINGRGEIV